MKQKGHGEKEMSSGWAGGSPTQPPLGLSPDLIKAGSPEQATLKLQIHGWARPWTRHIQISNHQRAEDITFTVKMIFLLNKVLDFGRQIQLPTTSRKGESLPTRQTSPAWHAKPQQRRGRDPPDQTQTSLTVVSRSTTNQTNPSRAFNSSKEQSQIFPAGEGEIRLIWQFREQLI